MSASAETRLPRVTAFDLDADEAMVRDAARAYFASVGGNPEIRALEDSDTGYDAERWAEIVGFGWPAMLVPEALDGAGGSAVEAGVLLEEVGRAAYPSPLLQATTTAAVAERLGAGPRRDALLRGIASGAITTLVAPLGPTVVTAEAAPEGYILRGGSVIVEWGHVAATLLVLAAVRGSGWVLAAVPADRESVRVRQARSLDNERLGVVDLAGVRVGPSDLLAAERIPAERAREALAVVRALRAAELAGNAARMVEMTGAYARERRQFGVPIGSFQAVQHHCAEMLTAADAARLTAYEALSVVALGGSPVPAAAVAGYVAGRSANRVAVTAAQVHAGIGAAKEHPLHHHFRRAKAMQLRLGSVPSQVGRVVDGVVLGSTPGPW